MTPGRASGTVPSKTVTFQLKTAGEGRYETKGRTAGGQVVLIIAERPCLCQTSKPKKGGGVGKEAKREKRCGVRDSVVGPRF